jgi:hypothetical protein
MGNVRFGSKADILIGSHDVRFTPESRHRSARWQCPLCAPTALQQFMSAALVQVIADFRQ